MTRRPKGEGAVYQRADGRWCASLDLGIVNGRRKRRVVYGKTESEVKRKLARARHEWETTGTVAAGAMTVEAWMRTWLDEIAPRRVRPSTLAGYRSKVEQYILPELGKRRLDRLEPQHVRALDTAMTARGLSSATRRQTHAILLRALKVAHREGKVTRNAAALVDPPKLDKDEPEHLSLDEITAVLRAAVGTPLESRWLAALVLGLRQGEALGLAWDAVDLDTGTLTVRRALQRITGQGLVMVEPKSRKSRRTIPLPTSLVKSLREHRARVTGPLVWGNPDGTPKDPRQDWQAWTDLLDTAGVRHVRLHEARHAAATVLAALGVHQAVVRDILGHSTETLTMAVYTHTDLSGQRKAMDLVDALHRPRAIEA